MELRVSEVARLLGESEDVVYRWAREGDLPAHRLHEQYYFNRVELQEWAAGRGRCLPPEVFAPAGASAMPSVRAALERGGIYYRVAGGCREEVLTAVSRLPGVPDAVDRGMLAQLLISRERLASTGVGRGIAIPHTRDPLIVHVDEPILMLCFLASPIEFNAIDGQPVHVLFTLLSPVVQKHLQALSQLAFLLHDAQLLELLRVEAPAETILAQIEALERSCASRS